VADAFDAMIGDRPYRKGIPVEMVEEIFRSGAGKQWDASVVDAYFRAREDIHELCHREQCTAPADLVQWS
jgi:HD-GYP domain-containing protein (c-di-GMP phosphodiesterase class II)